MRSRHNFSPKNFYNELLEDVCQRLRQEIVDAAQEFRLEANRALAELRFELMDDDSA